MTWILLVGCVGFGIARFIVPVEGKINKRDIFKDLAHIFVGILIGWAIAGVVIHEHDDQIEVGVAWVRWGMVIGLTGLEVVAFIVRKKKP